MIKNEDKHPNHQKQSPPTANAGKVVGRQESVHIVGGTVNCCSYHSSQWGGSSKKETQNYPVAPFIPLSTFLKDSKPHDIEIHACCYVVHNGQDASADELFMKM